MLRTSAISDYLARDAAFAKVSFFDVRLVDPNTLQHRFKVPDETSIGVSVEKQESTRTYGGDSAMDRYSLSLDIMIDKSEPYSVLETLSDKAEELLDNYKGLLGKTSIIQCYLQTTISEVADGGEQFVDTLVFDVATQP